MLSINDAVVQRLNKYLEERKITQNKLSQLSCVPLSTIKSIMQRKTKDINLKTIILFADALQVSPSEFIKGEDFEAKNLDLD